MAVIGRCRSASRKPLPAIDLRVCPERNLPIPVSMLNNPARVEIVTYPKWNFADMGIVQAGVQTGFFDRRKLMKDIGLSTCNLLTQNRTVAGSQCKLASAERGSTLWSPSKGVGLTDILVSVRSTSGRSG